MSDQKCIYRYDIGEGTAVCGKAASEHDGLHDFQPPLEITDEAVEAAARTLRGRLIVGFSHQDASRKCLEAALSVMQKGQDK